MNSIIHLIINTERFYKLPLVCVLFLSLMFDSYSQTDRLHSLISSNDLVYSSITQKMDDGIPVGNGKFGGLLVATKDGLIWQMNHTDFWRYSSQSNVHKDDYGARPYGLGRLSIRWQDDDITQTRDIEQRLSLYDAIFSLDQKSSAFSIENLFDMENDCGIFKLQTSNVKPIKINIELECWRSDAKFFKINSGIGITDSTDFARSPQEIAYLQKLTSNKYIPHRSTQATGLKVIGSRIKILDGTKMKRTIQFELKAGQEVILYVGTTVFEGRGKLINPVQKTIELLERESKKSYSKLKTSHNDWWKKYWKASYIQIESSDSLAAFAENLWYLHLYEMAIADRGKYPIKFNGGNWIINNDDRQWGGGYWHFNQQYTHMTMLAANHLEFLDNYYDPLYENLELLKATSTELWKHSGAFLHETHSPEGVAYQVNRDCIYTNNPMWTGLVFSSGCECAFQMYKYALYNGNEKYMKEKVYPFLREVCLFYKYHLKKDEKGIYYIYPSNMHENFWSVKNPLTDLAAIRSCFPILISMYDKYGGDNNEKESFKEILNNLSPFPKGKWLTNEIPDMGVYISGIDTTIDMFAPAILMKDSIIHNRHGMDSYTVYPFELTLPGKEGYQTAVNTFNNRFYKPTRDILQHDMLPAAMLGMPNEARNCMLNFLSVCDIRANGLVPESDIYSVSLGLNLMFLQSQDGVIQIFPACPDNWDVSFMLRAEGPLIVEASKKNNKVSVCNIHCLKSQNIAVKNCWNAEVEVYDGQKLIASSSNQLIKWQGVEGKNYLLVEKGVIPDKTSLPIERTKNDRVKKLGNHQLGLE